MNDVMHEQKFPGMKDMSSFLLIFIHPRQLILHEPTISWPFKPFMVRKQSETETEPCNQGRGVVMELFRLRLRVRYEI